MKTLEDMNKYRTFLQRILELRDTCANPPRVREIDLLIDRVNNLTLVDGTQANTPLAVISFDCEGNVSTFSPELLTLNHPCYDNFIFGNVFENSLEDIFANPKFLAIDAEVQRGVAECRRTCDYFGFCGGGCPAKKLIEKDTFDSTETTHCRLAIQVITDVVLAYLEKLYEKEGV